MKGYLIRLLLLLILFTIIPVVLGLAVWLVTMFISWEVYLPGIQWTNVRICIVIAFLASLFLAADE